MVTAASDAPVKPREPMPIEVRVIAVILVIEVVAALWMHLHAEQWLAVFLTHLPALGLAGLAWGVVPEGSKDVFRDKIRGVLTYKPVWIGLVCLLGAMFLTTCFVSSVHVASVDPDVRTRLQLIAGERSLADSAALDAAQSRPLNRLTTPVTFRTWFAQPFGRRMWVYGGHLASLSHHVYPWRPTMLQYPDDFDTLATLAVLPTSRMSAYGKAGAWPVLIIRDAVDTSIVLLRDSITMNGLLVGFPDVSRPDSAQQAQWRERAHDFAYAELLADADSEMRKFADEDAAGTAKRWSRAPARRSIRPLVVGDRLEWELRSHDGKSRTTDTLQVTHAITELYLDP
jgi:hypothetical protein